MELVIGLLVFSIENGLEQGDALSPLVFNFVLDYTIRIARAYPHNLYKVFGPDYIQSLIRSLFSSQLR